MCTCMLSNKLKVGVKIYFLGGNRQVGGHFSVGPSVCVCGLWEGNPGNVGGGGTHSATGQSWLTLSLID